MDNNTTVSQALSSRNLCYTLQISFRRFDNSVSFGKGWADYATGFGTLSDDGNFNYWFGNDNLYYLVQSGPMAIRFNMKYCGDDGLYTSTYNSFLVIKTRQLVAIFRPSGFAFCR